ncbi:MAG: glycosyltransferase family 2 protein [Sulfitobacter sp.]|jgi:polyisoprenyl-phosphate glycosyltransferase|uniref:glycosyltransferase family 2 protein n=1 Tax=Sulfitobacter sp. TaxID=1903071 RepID=UPI000C113D5C|nr:glycosyltransferase [Roseobacter sp.]MBV49371.1 glycosyltransferase [Roseobacter sp.]PHR09425.1 MAG: glycosyltransferase [Sulfitobacter sp.]|tara:strand:+ start:3775 stop:4725 length:951 start_codon:yes stop_codon:yes gene_type:complete
MYLSVVIPCMNEESSIPGLVARLTQAIGPWRDRAEIILVDDGSTDATWQAIEAARAVCPQVVGLKLSGNRGHQIALTAGLEAAQGDRIFMLDADLQDPPELLTDMMFMMDRGFDVVYGRRSERRGETLFKKVSAHLFYRFLNVMSDVPIPQDTGDFRLVNRRSLDAVLAMPERARFIRGMFAWAGFKQVGIEYIRSPREMGETKYPLRAMVRFAIDAMTAFSTKPLRLATRLSFVSLLMAALIGVYVVYSLIIYQTAPGWASVVLAISFFSGVQLLTLGILGEYIGRLYVEAKNRPLYFVSEEARDIAPVAQRLRA